MLKTSRILNFDIGICLGFGIWHSAHIVSGEVHPRLACGDDLGGDKSRPYVTELWRRRRMHDSCSGEVHPRLVGGDETDALSFKPDCSVPF
jgi:hypothetical protein